MTVSPFYLLAPAPPEALGAAVARHFGIPAERVCVYTNAWDIVEASDERPAGPLNARYEASPIRVYLSLDAMGPLAGWFAIETELRKDNDFEDRPLARAVAAALGQPIVFRDPVPDPYDNDYVEAAQIQVEPTGAEIEMWLVEYGDDAGRDITELLRRDIFNAARDGSAERLASS